MIDGVKVKGMFPEGLLTPRLVFRPIALGDARPIFDAYAQDPVASKFLTWRPHRRLADTEAYVARCLAATDARTYALVGRQDGRLLGAFDLRCAGPCRVGYGYVLARPAWGQGLMTEALAEAGRWTLGRPDIWRFGDVCDVDNIASARVMEKAGLSREGILRRWGVHPNIGEVPRDCYSYAMVRG